MSALIQIDDISKTYADGHAALVGVSLAIERGEILALLGPNGAGKTTLISIVCGTVTASDGRVSVGGFDIEHQYRQTRSQIGLVPQELALEPFATVWNTVRFSRALFGKRHDDAYLERLLGDLSLWDKKDRPIMALSGGMKRRVSIAKALSHEPKILFLDEPTAGVDVELRQQMWALVDELRQSGVTIVLTTHYIEEAEEIADRVAVINHGRILLIDDKRELMKKLGRKEIMIELAEPLSEIPPTLSQFNLQMRDDGRCLVYTSDESNHGNELTGLLTKLVSEQVGFRDLNTKESSLEEIFVSLVKEGSQ